MESAKRDDGRRMDVSATRKHAGWLWESEMQWKDGVGARRPVLPGVRPAQPERTS
jgi:hypothetical protein